MNLDKCPLCAEEVPFGCKCPRGDRRCSKGHEWHRCVVHKRVVVGPSDHSTDTMTCTCDKEVTRGQRLLALMLGRRFGALTIINVNNLDSEIWFCRCDCGNAVDVLERSLISYPRRIACGDCHQPATVPPPWRQ